MQFKMIFTQLWIIVGPLLFNIREGKAMVSQGEDYVRTGVGVTLIPDETVLFAVSDVRPVVYTILPPTAPKFTKHPRLFEDCNTTVSTKSNELCRRHARTLNMITDELNQFQKTVAFKYKALDQILQNMATENFADLHKRTPGLIPFIGTGLSYLFGLSTGDQLETLCKHVIKTNANVKVAAKEREETLGLLTNLKQRLKCIRRMLLPYTGKA